MTQLSSQDLPTSVTLGLCVYFWLGDDCLQGCISVGVQGAEPATRVQTALALTRLARASGSIGLSAMTLGCGILAS